MENDDFDITRKVILRFANENRPGSDVQRGEQITLNLVDESGEHYCLDGIATWKELYPVSYVIHIDTDWHGYPFLGDIIVNTTQHDLDGVVLKYKQKRL